MKGIDYFFELLLLDQSRAQRERLAAVAKATAAQQGADLAEEFTTSAA